jgi:hypothetical protein
MCGAVPPRIPTYIYITAVCFVIADARLLIKTRFSVFWWIFSTFSSKIGEDSLNLDLISNLASAITKQTAVIYIYMLSGSLVTTTWRFLRSRMEETASR